MVDRRCDISVKFFEKELPGDADSQRLQLFFQGDDIVLDRGIHAGLVFRIEARDRLEDDCGVRPRPRNWSYMIKRDGKRDHAPGATPPVGWLQANHAAQRCRLSNGACGVSTDRAVDQSGSDCGGGTSGRAARDVLRGVPGVVHFAEITPQRTAAVSKLVEV